MKLFKIEKYNKSFKNFIQVYFSSSFFISFFIVSSGLKLFGYAIFFLIFFPAVSINIKRIFSHIKKSSIQYNPVLLYFLFLIIQTFIGGIFLKDLRVFIFWIPFFLSIIYIYHQNLFNLQNLKNYKKNIIDIIYNSTILYFILYLILTIYSIFYYGISSDIQKSIWVGSSVAFNLLSYLYLILYIKLKNKDFKFSLTDISVLILSILLIGLHESRLGYLYLISFTFAIFFKTIFQKKFINGIIIISIIVSMYSFSISLYQEIHNKKNIFSNLNNISQLNKIEENLIKSKNNHIYSASLNASFFKEFNSIIKIIQTNQNVFNPDKRLFGNNTRLLELIIGINKFEESSLKEKLFGTGWYTSRITINNTRNKFIDYISPRMGCSRCLIKSDKTSLQGAVAILIDTGLIGFCFTIYLYLLSSAYVLNSHKENILKALCLAYLGLNFFCLFIGYPLVNIPFIMFFIPNGFLSTILNLESK